MAMDELKYKDCKFTVNGIDVSNVSATTELSESVQEISANTQQFSVIDNPEFVRVILDAIGKVTIGTKLDGSTYIYKIDSPTIDTIIKSIPDTSKLATKEEVTSLSNRVDKISDVGDAVGRNIHQSSRLANACRINKDANGSKDFQMLIITDTHGTNLCVENAIKITNGFPTIDCLIHCGDITSSTYDVSYAKTFYGLLAKCSKPWLITIGNHDIGNTMFVYYGASHEDAYKTYIKPMIDAGILLDGEYEDGKPYYYHDFPTRKVRVISIYEYQCPLDVAENEYWEEVSYDETKPMMQTNTTYTYDESSPVILNCGDYKGGSFRLKKTVVTVGGQYADTDTMPKYKCGRADRVIMKDQAEWLIRTLNSVPANYGVIIATHNPAILESTNQTSRKFAVNTSYKGRDQGQYCMQTDLLAEIVNAFNNMATLDLKVVMSDSGWNGSGASYLNTKVDGDLHYCYQLSADFTDRNPTAYFACYIGGHSHEDLIFKHDTYNSQYAINPLCGITERANSANCDVARPYNYDNQAYDALTTISVKKNRIALARIGNDQTIQGESRDFEIINL